MEDRYVLVEEASALFGGVYDGHGGAAVADLVAAELHRKFFQARAAGLGPEAAFLRAYEETDRATGHFQHCGTTAANFFVQGDRLAVAHVGDARIVLVTAEGAEQLTEDHRLDDPRERERILGAGGEIEEPYVMRGGYGLMPTRVLGDGWFHPVGAIATPDVGSRALTSSDVYLIAATDGLWDVLDNDHVGRIARSAPGAQQAAVALSDAAFAAGCRDNLTILVVSFAALA
jgi:serine/threonine protein phosphatase PrpC